MTATRRYANARLTAIRHIPHEDKLILSFDEHEDCEFTGVVDFSLNGFYPHNILFDLSNLSYYIHSGENWQIFHLSPQAGMGGVIVCATF